MSEEAKLKQLNDHDLLIQISTKLTGLCIQFHDVKKGDHMVFMYYRV